MPFSTNFPFVRACMCAHADPADEGTSPPADENKAPGQQNGSAHHYQQLPLKLVMDPRGKTQDMNTLNNNHGFGTNNGANHGMMSPDKCAELVSALHAPQGKGTVRRRRRLRTADECKRRGRV